MRFEKHQFHDPDSLLQAMRDSWSGVWVQPQGDSGDALPLSWVARLGQEAPEWQAVISQSLATLLLEDPKGLGYDSLILLREVSWNPIPAVADWIVRERDALKAVQSPVRQTRSLFGELVHLIKDCQQVESSPGQLAEVLADVDAPQDGYPNSLVLASVLDPERYLQRVPVLFEDVDDDELASRVLMLLGSPQPVCDEAFSLITESSPEHAQRVAAVVKSSLEVAADRVEQGLADPNLPESAKSMLRQAQGSHAVRWKALARRMGRHAKRVSD